MKETKVLVIFFLILLSLCAISIKYDRTGGTGFVKLVIADRTIYIRSDGSVEGTDKIKRDGNVYTFTDDIDTAGLAYGIIIERDNIVVDGAGHLLKGRIVDIIEHFSQSKPLTTGIKLEGRNNVTIKNLKIMEFNTGLRGNCTNIKVLGNRITNNVEGIWFSGSSLNTFSGNNITDNSGNGVLLESCSNCTISENNITGNYYGIRTKFFSNYNIVFGNKVTKNSVTGIQIEFSSNFNIVSGNCIIDNYHGIGISDSFNNLVSGNNVTNKKFGIWLGGQASNNIFSGNNIANNEIGVYIREAGNNKFYNNNFINNTKQVYDFAWDFPHVTLSVNIWNDDYPSGGNYWSDYEDRYPDAKEMDGSGIWDTPYVIGENNQDNYPLMKPIVIPESPDKESPTISNTEPFPTIWIVAATSIIAIGIAILLVFSQRSIKRPGKPDDNTAPHMAVYKKDAAKTPNNRQYSG